MELPIVFTKCPVCGSEERLGKQRIAELKEEGKLNKSSFPDGPVLTIPLLDPNHPPSILLANSVKIPVLNYYWDACANPECGSIYCWKFDQVEAQLPVQFQRGATQ